MWDWVAQARQQIYDQSFAWWQIITHCRRADVGRKVTADTRWHIHRCCVRLRVSFSLFVFRFSCFVFAETYAHASRERPQDLPQDCLDGMDVMLGVACRAGVVGASGPRWRVIVTHGLGFPSRFQIPRERSKSCPRSRHARSIARSLCRFCPISGYNGGARSTIEPICQKLPQYEYVLFQYLATGVPPLPILQGNALPPL